LFQEQGRLLLVGLLQRLERAPLRQQERVLLQGLVPAQVQGRSRQQARRWLRCEGRVRLKVRVQRGEQALLRCDGRVQTRGPGMGLERELLQRQERLLLMALLRRLLRVPEQGQLKGQGTGPTVRGTASPKSDRAISDER